MPKTNKKMELKQGTIIDKQQLNSVTKKIVIYAPDIATKAKAGQFVILKVNTDSERIPLTLSSWDKKKRNNHQHIPRSRLLNS
jgi:NAD(P)H-flavin reductase